MIIYVKITILIIKFTSQISYVQDYSTTNLKRQASIIIIHCKRMRVRNSEVKGLIESHKISELDNGTSCPPVLSLQDCLSLWPAKARDGMLPQNTEPGTCNQT